MNGPVEKTNKHTIRTQCEIFIREDTEGCRKQVVGERRSKDTGRHTRGGDK